MPVAEKEPKKKEPVITEAVINGHRKKSVPEGLWTKCPSCQQPIFTKTLAENYSVCEKCDHHFGMGALDRLNLLIDDGTFEEINGDLVSEDPLDFEGVKSYRDKLKADQKRTGLKDACITGTGKLHGITVALAVTDSRFIMGSMGSVVGEKITRLIEHAIDAKLPLIIVAGSGGGARMYEGALSLMQMAKTSAALSLYKKVPCPFISVLTNPTMGGVMASFSSLGDVIVAEPKALIGFAGPRVIAQTIRQKLPENFQTSEFLLSHGLIDKVIDRREMKDSLRDLLGYLKKKV